MKQLGCMKNIGKYAMTEGTYLILKVQRRELGIYLNYVTNPSAELKRFSEERQSPNSLQILIGAQNFSKPEDAMCPFLQKYTLCFSGDAPSRCSHVSSQQHLWSRKPGLSLMRINPLLQPAFCNRNRVSSSF